MQYDLGYVDLEQKTLQPLDSPFGTRLSPMSGVNPSAGQAAGRKVTALPVVSLFKFHRWLVA
jgi:hypothetical protein